MFKKIAQNQGGFAHLLLVLVGVLVASGVGFAAWRVMDKNKSNDSVNQPASTTNNAVKSKCNQKISDSDLCKFAANFDPKTPFKATATSTDSGSGNAVTVLESDGKDNLSMVVSVNGKEQSSSIFLNGFAYVKGPGSSQWIKYPSTVEESFYNLADDLKIDPADITNNGKISYKAMGKEACGELNCFKYQVIDAENAGRQLFIWFDDKDYQLRRLSTKDAESTNDITFSFQAVTIKEPSPVKSLQD